ncbi:MAG: hypothetical protein V3W00_04975 [Candidatus Brocadiales bacterium]
MRYEDENENNKEQYDEAIIPDKLEAIKDFIKTFVSKLKEPDEIKGERFVPVMTTTRPYIQYGR